MKLNFVLWLLGRELLLWPSQPVVFGSNPVGELMIRREHGQLRLKLRVVGPVVEDIMVYGEAPVSPGRNKPRHPVFLGLLPAPLGGWSDITESVCGAVWDAGGWEEGNHLHPAAAGWVGRPLCASQRRGGAGQAGAGATPDATKYTKYPNRAGGRG